MHARRKRFLKRFLLIVSVTIIMTALTGVTAMAEQLVDIQEGTYYLKAVNGNAKGQVLYWNEKAEDQNVSMMFESCGGSHADYEIWYITKNRNFDDYYGIYLYKDYNTNIPNWKDKCKRIEIDNLTGSDMEYPSVFGYLTSTSGPHVFCGSFGNQDDAFRFWCQDSTKSYTNLIIESRDDQYRFFRHKDVKLFKHDIIYVKANTKHDTSDKLWELVPVNYVKSMTRTAPSVKAYNNGKVRISCSKLRDKIKNTKVWKNAKYIEIQCSTDKNFKKRIVKRIEKGSFNKAGAKTKFRTLKKNKTYYVRMRLVDKKGVCSNWSKKTKVKTKK